MSFSDRFCEHYGVSAEAFEGEVLKRSLYPCARIFRGFLGLIPGYFKADIDFIQAVGRISRRRDFGLEEIDFVHHPANRGFLRRKLKLRVSARRLYRFVREVLPEPATGAVSAESFAPWPTPEPKKPRESAQGES